MRAHYCAKKSAKVQGFSRRRVFLLLAEWFLGQFHAAVRLIVHLSAQYLVCKLFCQEVVVFDKYFTFCLYSNKILAHDLHIFGPASGLAL